MWKDYTVPLNQNHHQYIDKDFQRDGGDDITADKSWDQTTGREEGGRKGGREGGRTFLSLPLDERKKSYEEEEESPSHS
ncbi:hypothetical protein EYF80_052637 [Liparis tanakae]|uniref:Uncharacterized protein n=1 Tax=Liparis tanakae TaxID=230148 RepID=A0A4Z2F8I5_9TELE|nr:hypothetical protein EYF80_052637 [Liparis tanakae]